MVEPVLEREVAVGDPHGRRNLVLAIALSLGLHSLVLSSLLRLNLEPQSAPSPEPAPLQVQLFPANPLAEPQPQAIAEPEPVIEQPAPIPNLPAPAPLALASPRVEPLAPPVEEAAEESAPPLLSVRDALQQSLIQQREPGNQWQLDCNLLEQEAGIIRCDENSSSDYDFEAVELNPVYRDLNPIRELSRTQRSLVVVTTNAPELAARLDGSTLPAGVSSYMMEQLEANITHLSNPGNSSLHMMKELTANPVEEQAARVLGDPWVINQYRLKQQRQRQIIPLTRAETIRNSVINLGLIWINLQVSDPRNN